jgi:O-acetylserine/cysteine efflux transporter
VRADIQAWMDDPTIQELIETQYQRGCYAGLAMNLEPIVAIGGSWLLLGQGLAPAQLAGGALVIAGIVGAQMAGRPAAGSTA